MFWKEGSPPMPPCWRVHAASGMHPPRTSPSAHFSFRGRLRRQPRWPTAQTRHPMVEMHRSSAPRWPGGGARETFLSFEFGLLPTLQSGSGIPRPGVDRASAGRRITLHACMPQIHSKTTINRHPPSSSPPHSPETAPYPPAGCPRRPASAGWQRAPAHPAPRN